MNRVIKPTCLLVILLLFVPLAENPPVLAQHLRVGISPAFYTGDLSPATTKWTAIAAVGLRFNQKERLNGSFQFSLGNLTSQQTGYSFTLPDGSTSSPNTFFRTSVISFHYDLSYNFIAREKLKVFAGLGLGLLRYQPKDDLGDNLLEKADTRPEGETYANTAALIPVKAGVLYLLPNRFGIEFQAMMMNTTTDYLDNISEWGTDSGNDRYYTFQLGLLIPLSLPTPSSSDQ